MMSHIGKRTQAKKKPVTCNHELGTQQDCRYNVIKRVCRRMDIKLDADEGSDWDIWWSDVPLQPERI